MSIHTLILLPGLHGNADLYAPLADQVSRSGGFKARAMAYPADASLDYDGLAALVARKISGSGPFSLVAESFSAPVAWRLARDLPGQARSVVLTAPVGGRRALPAMATRMSPGALFTNPFSLRAATWWMTGSSGQGNLVRSLRATLRRLDGGLVKARLALALAEDGDPGRPLDVPALLLQGTQDRLVPPNPPWVTRRFSNLSRAAIDGPHLLLQVRPRESWQVIRAFLNRHGGQ